MADTRANSRRELAEQGLLPGAKKGNRSLASTEYFAIFLVGECGDGKTALTQYMTDEHTRQHLPSGIDSRGVTKEVSFVWVRDEVMKNTIIIDIPGIGDQDVKLTDLVEAIVDGMVGIKVHAIVLMTAMAKGRSGMGAQASCHFVRHGFVKSFKNVIFCGTQRDVYIAQNVDKDDFDMDTDQGKADYKEEVRNSVDVWRKQVADPVTNEMFADRHAGTVTIQLHMRKKKGTDNLADTKICDPEGKKTDVDELIGLLKNLQREKIEAANWETPDVDKLMGDVAKEFGRELPSEKEMQDLKAKIAELETKKEERRAETEKLMEKLVEQAAKQSQALRDLSNRQPPQPQIIPIPTGGCCIS